jgi:hypothetical protein
MLRAHAAIIDRLGGRHAVADLLGLRYETVKKWANRAGIPARHWHRICALDPTITAEYLSRTKPRDPRGGR